MWHYTTVIRYSSSTIYGVQQPYSEVDYTLPTAITTRIQHTNRMRAATATPNDSTNGDDDVDDADDPVTGSFEEEEENGNTNTNVKNKEKMLERQQIEPDNAAPSSSFSSSTTALSCANSSVHHTKRIRKNLHQGTQHRIYKGLLPTEEMALGQAILKQIENVCGCTDHFPRLLPPFRNNIMITTEVGTS